MGRLIPNQNVYVGFAPTIASIAAPTQAEMTAGVNLTPYLISFNASSTGNTVPTPSLSTLFETNVPGTVQATCTSDWYRDDATGTNGDLAWKTLPRKAKGYWVVSRFGSAGAQPASGQTCEVWPVTVVSRTMSNMANNSVMTFTVNCSVTSEPNEAATAGA